MWVALKRAGLFVAFRLLAAVLRSRCGENLSFWTRSSAPHPWQGICSLRHCDGVARIVCLESQVFHCILQAKDSFGRLWHYILPESCPFENVKCSVSAKVDIWWHISYCGKPTLLPWKLDLLPQEMRSCDTCHYSHRPALRQDKARLVNAVVKNVCVVRISLADLPVLQPFHVCTCLCRVETFLDAHQSCCQPRSSKTVL